MKKFAARIALLAAMMLTPLAPAAATPPDIINVRDEVLGISDKSIYILRQTDDNLGVYQSSLSDVYLIALDRRGGGERRWPIYRVRTDTDEKGRVTTKTEMLRGSVNPYAILHREKGIALPAASWQQDGKIDVAPNRVTMIYGDEPGVEYQTDILLSEVTGALGRLAASIPNYPRLAPVTVKDLIGGQKFAAENCTFTDPLYYPGTNGNVNAGLMRVKCEDDGQQVSLLLPIIHERIIVAGD